MIDNDTLKYLELARPQQRSALKKFVIFPLGISYILPKKHKFPLLAFKSENFTVKSEGIFCAIFSVFENFLNMTFQGIAETVFNLTGYL